MENRISIILPSHNEADSLATLLPELIKIIPDAEILVVNDGSTDETLDVCHKHKVISVSHPYKMGNGAAIKTGARAASGDIFIFMDGDGQHRPDDISKLLEKFNDGYEMVVGARVVETQFSFIRRCGNLFYNYLASFMTGNRILDLTCGFRVVRARHFRKFLYLLPNGFSYPTTCTMAFFRSGLPVAYVPIKARQNTKSHISLVSDGIRFFVIILKIGALFSPMRLFLPTSMCVGVIGLTYYAYTYITASRFTNMGALLLLSSLFIFLIGILAELISSLHYKGVQEDQRKSDRNY